MAFTMQHLESDSRQLFTPDNIQDPLSFVPLDIRRKMGDWEDRANSVLRRVGLLAERDFYSGKPEARLDFFETPITNENSDALYIFQGLLRKGKDKNKDWVGIYSLLPNQTTSEHAHPPGLIEEYVILAGEMTLHEENRIARVVDGVDKFTIQPGNRHHSRTEDDQFALVMVRMIGAGRFPHDQRHLGSVRPEVRPEDYSPRREAIDTLARYYQGAYGNLNPEALLRRIKTMSFREILKTIQISQSNPLEFKENPRYSWIVNF